MCARPAGPIPAGPFAAAADAAASRRVGLPRRLLLAGVPVALAMLPGLATGARAQEASAPVPLAAACQPGPRLDIAAPDRRRTAAGIAFALRLMTAAQVANSPPTPLEGPAAAGTSLAPSGAVPGAVTPPPTPAANIALSPFGVAAVLATLELGADAPMRQALSRALGRAKPTRQSFEALRRTSRLLAAASGRGDGPLALADALFVDRRVRLAPSIADIVQAEAGFAIDSVDFTKLAGVEAVNNWVAARTRGRIPTILAPGDSPELVAVNAFAFKDCWRFPFDPAATAPRSFTGLDGVVVERDTMSLTGAELAYGTSGRFLGVELPYADDRFVLSLVTTRDIPAGPAAFDRLAVRHILAGWGLGVRPVTLRLPRFTGGGEHDMLAVLVKLGLNEQALASGGLPGFAPGLKLSALRQKTFVATDEQGTEANAATAALASRGLGLEAPPLEVALERPFIYALRHRPTGTLLMVGWIGDPGQP